MFTIIRFSLITAVFLAFTVPCLANEYDKDAERTAERQAKIDADQHDYDAQVLEERAEAAVVVDDADSVEARGIEQARADAMAEGQMDRDRAERILENR